MWAGARMVWTSFCAEEGTPRLSYQLAHMKGGKESGKGEAEMLSAVEPQKIERGSLLQNISLNLP